MYVFAALEQNPVTKLHWSFSYHIRLKQASCFIKFGLKSNRIEMIYFLAYCVIFPAPKN